MWLTSFSLRCPACGWGSAPELQFRCPRCATALETDMVLDHAARREDEQPEAAFADYLPLGRLGVASGTSVRTPCRRTDRLGERIGLVDLWVKDETVQPTGSTKDRLAAVVVSVFRQFGVTEFVASSSGNTALALARAVSLDGSMRAHLFCPCATPTAAAIAEWPGHVLHLVDGSYADALGAAGLYAAERGLVLDAGFFNWARREGLKVAYLEAFVEMPREPDVVIQAISSGMGMMAARRAAADFQASGHMMQMPRLVMVQQATCAPMVDGWRRGARELGDDDVITEPEGRATAILLGDARASYPYMRDIAESTGGDIVSVAQAELVAARELLWETESIQACYAWCAAVAAACATVRSAVVSPTDTLLLHLTGKERAA